MHFARPIEAKEAAKRPHRPANFEWAQRGASVQGTERTAPRPSYIWLQYALFLGRLMQIFSILSYLGVISSTFEQF